MSIVLSMLYVVDTWMGLNPFLSYIKEQRTKERVVGENIKE